MKLPISIAAAAIALALVPAHAAQAPAYPSKPIRIIVPSSPGGGLDFVARATGQRLAASWGQSVVIDNRSEVPTMAEQGLPAATITGWYAFLAPARTPRVIVDRVNAELTRILQLPEIRDQLAREGSEPALGTPEQLGKHLAAEIQRLSKIVKASGAANP